MDKKPVISIVIPVYNVGKYLRYCLDSILCQTFNEWEAILVNDGSRDESGEICDEYCSKDSRFRVFHKENGGVSTARNRGIEEATGEWICFVDSDDALTPDALESMLRCVQKTNADTCICSFGNPTLASDDSIKVLGRKEILDVIWACLAYKTDRYVECGFFVDSPWAKLFHSSIIREYNLRYIEGLSKSEDAIFDAYYYHYSRKIALYAHQVYYYTLNPGSISHTFNWNMISMLIRVLQEEQRFVNMFYQENRYLRDALSIRSFVGLEQLMFEAGTLSLTTGQHIKALRLYLLSDTVHTLIGQISRNTFSDNGQIAPNKTTIILSQKRCPILLYTWVRFCLQIFTIRVRGVSRIKKIMGISDSKSLREVFKNYPSKHEK